MISPAALLIALTALGVFQQPSTEFDRFPAEQALTGQPHPPQLTAPRAREFQTVLTTAAAKGPNFNGHYRIAQWGCGTACLEWAVIDLTDGRIWFNPGRLEGCAATAEATGRWQYPSWIEASVKSRLIYVYLCRGNQATSPHGFDTRMVYEWRGRQPVLLRSEPFTPTRIE